MNTPETPNHYDAIIIGSGMGGLATASILAQTRGWRVLVLERHYTPGGFTHTFARPGGYRWDVGIHYCGELHEGGMTEKLNRFITRGGVKWLPMTDPYDKFVYPDFTVNAYVGKENYIQELLRLFPDEEAAIRQYFVDLKSVSKWATNNFMAGLLPGEMSKMAKNLNLSMGNPMGLMTTGEYLDARFKNPKLKGALASQWGDYGLPPRDSAFAMHAVLVRHYLNGGYYPEGGSATIADSIIPIIEEKGGQVLINHPVERILIEGSKATGVRVKLKNDEIKEFFAPVVVSNAGAYATYLHFLPAELTGSIPEQLKALRPPATANVTVYLGLNRDPRELGFYGENHWITDNYDHNAGFDRRDELAEGKASMAFLSFPSVKDPKSTVHTAEIISFVSYDEFKAWGDKRWKKRGKDYETLKSNISEALIDFVEQRYPGFRSMIAYQELSTPITTEHFTGHYLGNIYGIPCRPERYQLPWLGAETPVENVYMTGADAVSPGVMGAMMSGFLTSAKILGGLPGMIEIMQAAGKADGGDFFEQAQAFVNAQMEKAVNFFAKAMK